MDFWLLPSAEQDVDGFGPCGGQFFCETGMNFTNELKGTNRFRVRRASSMYVKEKEMVKWLGLALGVTVTGLAGWTAAATQGAPAGSARGSYNVCPQL